MAGKGPPPKDPTQRRRQNVDPVPRTQLAAPKGRPPALRIAKTARPETRAWWKTWSTSPNASVFTPVMWERLQMVALIVDGYFASPTVPALAEIRRAEAELGAMPADRARLRWDLPEPAAPARGGAPAKATPSDFKERKAQGLRLVKGA